MLAGSLFLVVGLVGCALRQSGQANAEEFPSALVFLQEPADTQFAHTQSAILNCKVEDRPRATITWRIAQTENPVNSNITGLRHLLPNGSLYFPSFSENRFDASVHTVGYQCIAENKLGTIVSRIAKLQAVIVRPYKVYTKDSMVMRGNTAVIKCIIPHQVRDHVRVLSWLKDSQPVILGGKYSFMPSGDLVITKVNDIDAIAMYHCITINILTGDRTSSNPAKLFLKDKKPTRPKMISDAFNITVLEGNTSELQCTAEGYPVPIIDEYSWRKDGITILMGNRFSRFAGGSLRIERTTFEDQGWYDCEVKSNGNSASMRVYLTVKVPLRLLIHPRRIVVPVSSSNSTMDCEVKGEPRPKITWLHNGQPISRESRIIITPNNQLFITKIHGEDVGVYQCTADNGQELVQSSAVLITGERNPTLEASTHRKVTKRGEDVSLWCKAFSQLTPEITWYLEEEQLHDGNDYSITSTLLNEGGPQAADQGLQSTLLVKSLSVEKSGKYRCIACNFGNCTAQAIYIYIDGSTSITSLPREVSAILGQELHVPCVAKGYPVPLVFWYKNGQRIPFDQRQSVQSNILSIFHLQQSDGGNYKCIAVNSQGDTDEAVVSVTVLELPDPQITAREWRQGKVGQIHCIKKTTDTTITWMKDGVIIPSSSNVEMIDMIIIRNLTTANSGNYKCIARNRAGIRSVSKQMTVYVPPKFTKEPISKQVLKGDTAQLTCVVMAVPPVRIDWSKNIGGKFVTVQIDHPRFQKLLDGTLVIQNVSEEDDGKYLCTAYNSVSEQESRHVNLTVQAPATIKKPPADRPAKVGSDITVTCTAIGNLPIKLVWINGTRPMANSSRVSITTDPKNGMINSTLTVRRLVLQDTQSYACSVNNTFGWERKVFYITAQQTPSPPSNLKVKRKSSRSVLLSWTKNFDGNAKLKGYLVEFKLHSNGWETGIKRRVESGLEFKVDGLKPASTYDMRVYAVNSLGRGDASSKRSVTTEEDGPSQGPKFSNLTSISATEIYVSWEPLPKESRNGVIRGYMVTFREKNKSSLRSVTVEGEENTRVNIKNLEPYTNYTVGLRAFTKVGNSPINEQQVRTDEGVPSRPPQSVTITVLSSQSMMVAWRRPPLNGINGRLQGYRVYYYSTRDPDTIFNETIMSPHDENVTLKRLGKFTMYKISVLALTRKGEGVASIEIGKTTFEDIPGAPSKVQAIPVEKRKIRVLWGPPDEPNGIIRGYLLCYSKEIRNPARSSSDKVIKVPVNGKRTFHSLSKLDSETVYYFWVRANTSVGTGNASDVIRQMTVDEIPANIFYQHLPVTMAKRASSAIFNCEAYGDPKPSVMWYSSGRDLHNTEKYRQLANGSLQILNVRVEDAGEYECTASNALGRKTVVRKLQVQTPPSPPTSIHFRLLPSAQSVNVTWREGHNGNSPVTLFVLEYKAHGDNWKVEYIHFNVKYHMLHHIDILKDYYFRMSAVNAVGNGRPSKILRVTFKDGAPPIIREYEKETAKPSNKQKQEFYGSPTFLGVLIGVSSLIVVVIVCLLLVAFRGGRINMDKVHAWRTYWKRRILGEQFPQREYNHGRSNGDRSDESPSNNGNLADSSSSLEGNRSTRGSQISLPRTNSMLRGHFTHEPIMEEEYPLPPPPAPYHSIIPSRGGQLPSGEETFSDSSSDTSFARPVYYKPILHDTDPVGHARRYVEPENNIVYPPTVYTVQRSLNGTPGIGLLGFRGNADGGSELDTASISRAMESNENLRRLAAASRASKNAAHVQSQETVYSQSGAPSKSRLRDSGIGPSRNDVRRMSIKSRGDSSLSHLTPVTKAVQNPQRRESESSQEPSPYHTGYERPRGLRDPRAYDSASSEYSSSRDELISALEFGKRHNLDKYYGIPTLETTSASSDATKSSEQDGICEFTASPRPLGDGCFAPTAIHQPQFNQNYIYMLDARRRGLDLGAVPLRSHNSSSVV